MELGGSPQQPPPEAFFANATLQKWHSGACRSSHPLRRSSQTRHYKNGTRGLAAATTPRGVLRKRDFTKMALGGLPQQPPPEAFFANTTLQKWHSGARRSNHPPRRSSQTRLYKNGTRGLAAADTPRGILRKRDFTKMALGGSPQQPPPEAFFANATLLN